VNSAAVVAARMVLIYVIGAGGVKIFFYFPEILSAAASRDLRDVKGRHVSEGTYLARGKVVAVNGRVEAVAVVVGIR